MAVLEKTLDSLMLTDGAMGVALVDCLSGMMLSGRGDKEYLELAAALNSQVLNAKRNAISTLGIKGELEDILITLSDQYHLIRPLDYDKGLFLYFMLSSRNCNLAMARYKLKVAETGVTF